MKTFNIMLKTINDVKDFVNISTRFEYDIDLSSGRYIVDAKSIMGIFSLDLSKPIEVQVHSEKSEEVYNILKRFVV